MTSTNIILTEKNYMGLGGHRTNVLCENKEQNSNIR